MKTIWFRSQADELSNMYRHKNCKGKCTIEVFGQVFVTSEQAYGYQKAIYHNEQKKAEDILSAEDPWKAYRIHSSIETSDDWHKDKEQYMIQVLQAKYKGCTGYRSYLENTCDTEHIEFEYRENTSNKYWGGQYDGRNVLGNMHKAIRDNPPQLSMYQNITKDSMAQGIPVSNHVGIKPYMNRIKDDVLIVTDSLGSRIQGRKMYQKSRCFVKKLRRKTISDASDYVEKIQVESKALVYVVGSNDLVHMSGEDTAEEAKRLIDKSKDMFPNTNVVLYAVPPRKEDVRWDGYERRRRTYNEIMENYCAEKKGVTMAVTTIRPRDICHDSVHLWFGSERIIVHDLKMVLNSIIGIKSYLEYDNIKLRTSEYNTGHYSSTQSDKSDDNKYKNINILDMKRDEIEFLYPSQIFFFYI